MKDLYFGGGEEDRTPDLMLAKHALSQLSYTPKKFHRKIWLCHEPERSEWFVVGSEGFEPSTPALSAQCSDHLSYEPSKLTNGL